jgi:hypothetical protein
MRELTRPWRVAVAGLLLGLSGPVAAQTAYEPPRTEWGDPDLRGTWPLEWVFRAGIPLQRPEAYGERGELTDDEFAQRLTAAGAFQGNFALDVVAGAPTGLAEWLRSTRFARRTSLIVDPPNGRLPAMTASGRALYDAGRNSFKDGQTIDWLTDLDSYDRCITRNLAAAILPWPENNGVRIFQSPGYVVLQLEVLGTRVIPIGADSKWPAPLRNWMGQSRGRWDGDTLVIETDAIVAGDSATGELSRRTSSPLNSRPTGVVPMSDEARAVERLTMTSRNTISYELTYADPQVFTAPWTAAIEWTRDDDYRIYEFACHERNMIRDMIVGSRAHRAAGQDGPRGTGVPQEDGTGRWTFPSLEGNPAE